MRPPRALAVAALGLAAVACTSPEARRTRGGGPGGDPGNRGEVVEMHEGSRPYADTPRLVGGVGLDDLDSARQAQRLSRTEKAGPR